MKEKLNDLFSVINDLVLIKLLKKALILNFPLILLIKSLWKKGKR